MATKKGQTKKAALAEAAAAGKSASDLVIRGRMKTRDGVVVSAKMAKTVVVAVERQMRHAEYGKYIRRTSKCYAHDEKGTCAVGDLVRISETRPMSRLKRWKVAEILRKAEVTA